MENIRKYAKWLIPLSGTLVAILGITIMFAPVENSINLVIVIGVAMFITGVLEIVSFYGKEEKGHSGVMLATGAISALLGFWTVFGSRAGLYTTILPAAFIILVMSSGVTRITGMVSQKSRSTNTIARNWIISFGVLGTIFMFLLIFNPVISTTIILYVIAFIFVVYGIKSVFVFLHFT